MRTAPLGDSGVHVSALSLGCMLFGTSIDEAASVRVLDRYVAAGGRFLDTANNYAFWVEGGRGGESETLLGRWMRDRGNRDELFLATKVGAAPGEDLSRGAIRRGVDDSLRRLGTDRIDLYYAHLDHRAVPLEETLGAFDELVDEGKALHIGCSNHVAWRIERARRLSDSRGWARYCCVQQRHSYLRPRPFSDLGAQVAAGEELLDYCAAEPGVALLAYSPLLSGAYTRRDREIPEAYRGADTDARLAALGDVVAATGATANQVVLAWLQATAPASIPVISASSEAQLEESLAGTELDLAPEHVAALDGASG